jgi:diguanylate cyclase (GGDEF)-like protein
LPLQYRDLVDLLAHEGRDPSCLIFEDELTGIYNRRFLLSYFEHKVHWEGQEDYPLSLLIIDLDRFKEVNDQLGHEVGDQALAWMASLLKEVAGDDGLPVRFGGDEFVLLLPKTGRVAARQLADHLLVRTRDRPFRLRDTHVDVPITLSIGFATAPEDANSPRALYHAADTALLHAKQSGRDQLAAASDADVTTVFPQTALYRLRTSEIAGRDAELHVIATALQQLAQGHSQFVIFEADSGMGKTTLLDTVRDNLIGDENFCTVMVSGDPHERYRPYSVASRVLIALLNRREDKGAALIEKLTLEELEHLAHLLPQLGELVQDSDAQSARGLNRQVLFATVAKLLPQAVDFRPLVLLVDDLHFVDEATLLLIRTLVETRSQKLFVCGSSQSFLRFETDDQVVPLERFFSTYHRELEIRRVKLRALDEGDIASYLRDVFPRLRTPPRFEAQLARTTQGNPLFLSEVIRKLVLDRKIELVNQEWVVEPLDESYLPRSLDEVLRDHITSLDDEGRQLLAHASAIGERIPLSVLAGSSGLDENHILDLLDQAEILGLIDLDFEDNDPVVRFLGKQVQDVSYASIDPEQRAGLHEDLGLYHEGLYQQRALSAPSALAYHFDRSANTEKAFHYSRLQLAFNQTLFDPEEAAAYAPEVIEEPLEAEPPLKPESISRVPRVLRAIMSAIRTIQLYPSESSPIAETLDEVGELLSAVLDQNEKLNLSQAQHVLLVNGRRLDTSRFSLLANSFVELLARSELQAIVFHRGVSKGEVNSLLQALAKLKQDVIDQQFWRDMSLANGLENIELRQVRYSRLRRLKGPSEGVTQPAEDERLSPGELSNVPKILRAFQRAIQNTKLYPLDSRPVGWALGQLQEAVERILSAHPSVSLTTVEGVLFANGKKLDTSGYEGLASSFQESLNAIGLRSISFLEQVPPKELFSFLAAIKSPPSAGFDETFWEALAVREQLAHIAFNQRDIKLGILQSFLGSVGVTMDDEESDGDDTVSMVRRIHGEPREALHAGLPVFGKELIIRGKDPLLRQMIERLFENFQQLDAHTRQATVRSCSELLDGLVLGHQSRFTTAAADATLDALAGETDPRVLHEFGTLLNRMAACAVQFSDYAVASRMFLGIADRQRQLQASEKEVSKLARLLSRRPDSSTQQLLTDDLKSAQTERQALAAQVIGSLGEPAVPMLIDVIKQERDFRIRHLAAELLAECGTAASEQVRRALITEVTVEQRFRLLEVIDVVTRDLRTELAYALGDVSPKIRRAGFRLFERLKDDSLISLVAPLARDDDQAIAKGAIRSLANLHSPKAVFALISLLEETNQPKVATACCQALGELGHPGAIDALASVLAQRKPPFFRRKWDEQVRLTALLALKQITHPRVAGLIERYSSDPEPRVRLAAQT